jgi:hypothetical protein
MTNGWIDWFGTVAGVVFGAGMVVFMMGGIASLVDMIGWSWPEMSAGARLMTFGAATAAVGVVGIVMALFVLTGRR